MKLAPPYSIEAGTMQTLGIVGVPALVFVNSKGVVGSAFVGTALTWDVGRFRQELANVEKFATGQTSITGRTSTVTATRGSRSHE